MTLKYLLSLCSIAIVYAGTSSPLLAAEGNNGFSPPSEVGGGSSPYPQYNTQQFHNHPQYPAYSPHPAYYPAHGYYPMPVPQDGTNTYPPPYPYPPSPYTYYAPPYPTYTPHVPGQHAVPFPAPVDPSAMMGQNMHSTPQPGGYGLPYGIERLPVDRGQVQHDRTTAPVPTQPVTPPRVEIIVVEITPPVVPRKPSINEIVDTFDWSTLYSNKSFNSAEDVAAFFGCITPTGCRSRAFINGFCQQFSQRNQGISEGSLHTDVRIKAIMALTGRNDLGRGTAELTFDALCFNDCENRLLTLTNMSHLGYPNVATTFISGHKARRQIAKNRSLNANGWNQGWNG